jgi:hypothetical protein
MPLHARRASIAGTVAKYYAVADIYACLGTYCLDDTYAFVAKNGGQRAK